ncbi:MAG: PorV/PorQ family protein [bacterium]
MLKVRCLTIAVIASMLLICSSVAFASDSNAMPFLRMGVGARALAMGGAFTAIADDATAAYWNPAGLAKIEHIEATFMYAANMAVDRQLNYFAYGHWLGKGGLGLSWLNAGMSDIAKRDASGNPLGFEDFGNNAIMISYGMEIGSLMLGGSAKILHQNMMGESDTGFGLDFGGMFNVTDNVTAAIMVRDIGSQYGDDEVPINWRFGTAVRAMDNAFVIGFDVDKVEKIDDFKIHLGAEYGMEVYPGYHAFFRAGLNSVEDKAFTTGIGIRVPHLQFDYSYITEPEEEPFGTSHRLSVTARF